MPNSLIPHADPGYLSRGRVPRFPLDSEANVRAGWAYCATATEYTDLQLSRIRAALQAAAARLRIELEGE